MAVESHYSLAAELDAFRTDNHPDDTAKRRRPVAEWLVFAVEVASVGAGQQDERITRTLVMTVAGVKNSEVARRATALDSGSG